MRRRTLAFVLAPLLFLAAACGADDAASASAPRSSHPRELSRDEAMGGHTLARHVARTDAQLRERLARERDISAASTYDGRAVAERVVADTLSRNASRLNAWLARTGRRPNLALRHHGSPDQPIGRTLERGAMAARPCSDAVVVLRWDERRGDYYVLTSYPEAPP